MKKFFALLIAVLLLATAPAQAEDLDVDISDISAEQYNVQIEKFFETLPKATGEYKSRKQPILIEGAMNIETEILIRALKNPVAYSELNYLFVAGTYKNYPVVVARTEQGVANAAASTALAIKKFNPEAVISQGTAGGHNPGLKIGDIIVGSSTFDYTAIKTDYSPRGAGIDINRQEMRGTYAYDKATKKFQPYAEYFPENTLFAMAFAVANRHGEFNVVSGKIATGNAWLQGLDHIAYLHETYGSDCEDMETCAVAAICQNAGIPFIGIRILSDNGTNSREYDPNTAKTCQKFVLLVVEDYINKFLIPREASS